MFAKIEDEAPDQVGVDGGNVEAVTTGECRQSLRGSGDPFHGAFRTVLGPGANGVDFNGFLQSKHFSL